MVHVSADRIADQAITHLDEAGPINTCMSNGLERWTRELGLPGLDTNSVSEGIRRAKDGYNGWRYHDGTDGLQRGNFGVWTHEALKSTTAEHVTVVDEVNGGMWRGIGSGTPSNRVARQPARGGFNPKTVLRGYLIAPTETRDDKPVKPPRPAVRPSAKPTVNSGDVYKVRKNDTLIKIAARHKTTWQRIAAANPPQGNRSSDFHILRPNLIIIGQKIRIP